MSVLVDTNVLVYAAAPGVEEHEAARAWLTGRFADDDTFDGLAWSALLGFVRIISNRRIMGKDAVGVPAAWDAADAYRRQRTALILGPGPTHHDRLRRLVATPGLASDDVPDVHLAALAIEHGVVLCSHDHGFARFRGLRWEDPLRPADGR